MTSDEGIWGAAIPPRENRRRVGGALQEPKEFFLETSGKNSTEVAPTGDNPRRTSVLRLVRASNNELSPIFSELYDKLELKFGKLSCSFTKEAVICQLDISNDNRYGFFEVHVMTHATDVFRIDYTPVGKHLREVYHSVDDVIRRVSELLNR